MTANTQIKVAKWGYVCMTVLMMFQGFIILAEPAVATEILYKTTGCLMIGFGIVKIIGYLSKDLYRLAFQFDLAAGILLMALGVILVMHTTAVVTFLSMMLGFFVLTDALLKIQIAVDAKAFGIHRWWWILLAALMAGASGFLLVLSPWSSILVIMEFFGAALIALGVLNLMTILMTVKIIHQRHPDDVY